MIHKETNLEKLKKSLAQKAQQLRATTSGSSQTACDSSFRESDDLFWPLQAPAQARRTHTHSDHKINLKKKTFFFEKRLAQNFIDRKRSH